MYMLNVAVIGAGAICPSHIQGYLTFSDRCRIVAVVDIYPDKAEHVIRKFGLQARALSDYREILTDERVDLVSICTPPSTHASIAIDCLRAGKHVLVEKPMAASLAECDEMIQAAQTSGKVLSVIAQNRFRTPVMKLKRVLDAGLAGRIVHAQVDSHWWRGYTYYDLWWRGTWESEGGGCTLNHAVHHIDMLQWMLGMPSEVQAVMSNVAHNNAEVEDLSIAVLRYPNRCLAQITSSVVHHGEEQQVIFQGERARVSMPWKLVASKARENGFPIRDEDLERQIQAFYDGIPEVPYEGHTGQIDNVLSAVAEGKPVLIDGTQGRQTLELIVSIYKSATLRQPVALPLTRDDPFYSKEGLLQHVPKFYEKKRAIERFQDNVITT